MQTQLDSHWLAGDKTKIDANELSISIRCIFLTASQLRPKWTVVRNFVKQRVDKGVFLGRAFLQSCSNLSKYAHRNSKLESLNIEILVAGTSRVWQIPLAHFTLPLLVCADKVMTIITKSSAISIKRTSEKAQCKGMSKENGASIGVLYPCDHHLDDRITEKPGTSTPSL